MVCEVGLMFRGIRYRGKGQVGMTHDIKRDVMQPFKEGHYTEAFGNMDAYIDNELESMLRTLYSSFKEQDLENEMIYATKKRGFPDVCKNILKSKGIIDNKIVSNIDLFKDFRNIVVHNVMPTTDIFKKKYEAWWEKIQTQEEFDDTAKRILGEGIAYGSSTWITLIGRHKELIKEGTDYYFSNVFYLKRAAQKKKKR